MSDEGLHPTPLSHFSCPSNSEDDDDDDEESSVAAALELVHVYPVVSRPPPRVRHFKLNQSVPFCSQDYSNTTKPTFIHAGWGDAYSG